MPTKQAIDISDLKLDDAHATAILEMAIENNVIDDYTVPKTKKERIDDAAENVAQMLDAYVNKGVTPDNDDEEFAAMGELIENILELAGISVDGDEVEFGDLPELDGSDGDNDGDGEAAVDIEDIIKGYEELSAASRVKAIKALELDMDDDDDYNSLVAIASWEEAQDKPSSRVLAYIDEIIPPEGEGGDDGEAEGEGEAPSEEPWEGYDKATAADIRKVLAQAAKDGDLTLEQIEYVRAYENGRKAPRSNVFKRLDELEAALGEGDGDGEEEKPQRRRGGLAGLTGGKAKPSSNGAGTITLTREMILEALAEGEIEIEV